MCTDQGASPEERRHRSEQFQCRLRSRLAADIFDRRLLRHEIAATYEAQTHCLRSGGFGP